MPVILLQAIVKDIDCDVAFGADEGDGLGCKSCESGTVFVKNLTMNTIQNRSAIQRCVPCPDGAKICNATAVEMMPGYLARKHSAKKLSAFPQSFWPLIASKIRREACGECDCVNRGRMVELSNLSRSFHCPNQLACRGGAVSSNVLTLMCAGGAITSHHLLTKNRVKHFHLEAETSRVKQALFIRQDWESSK